MGCSTFNGGHSKNSQQQNSIKKFVQQLVRQEAVAKQADVADLTIVVGDPKSNNSNRLAQVSQEIAGTKAYRVADVSEIQLEWLQGVENVAVTAGASTPTPITKEVIAFLEQYNPMNPATWERVRKVPLQKYYLA